MLEFTGFLLIIMVAGVILHLKIVGRLNRMLVAEVKKSIEKDERATEESHMAIESHTRYTLELKRADALEKELEKSKQREEFLVFQLDNCGQGGRERGFEKSQPLAEPEILPPQYSPAASAKETAGELYDD